MGWLGYPKGQRAARRGKRIVRLGDIWQGGLCRTQKKCTPSLFDRINNSKHVTAAPFILSSLTVWWWWFSGLTYNSSYLQYRCFYRASLTSLSALAPSGVSYVAGFLPWFELGNNTSISLIGESRCPRSNTALRVLGEKDSTAGSSTDCALRSAASAAIILFVISARYGEATPSPGVA